MRETVILYGDLAKVSPYDLTLEKTKSKLFIYAKRQNCLNSSETTPFENLSQQNFCYFLLRAFQAVLLSGFWF